MTKFAESIRSSPSHWDNPIYTAIFGYKVFPEKAADTAIYRLNAVIAGIQHFDEGAAEVARLQSFKMPSVLLTDFIATPERQRLPQIVDWLRKAMNSA